MPYKGQVNPSARKRIAKVLFSPSEFAVIQARADANTQGNISRYIREQIFGADVDAGAETVAQGDPVSEAMAWRETARSMAEEVRREKRGDA